MGTLSVLHIDDNAGDLTLAREALSPHGVRYVGIDEPVTAVGRLAEDCTSGKPPSAILLDLNIGCMDGFDVLRLLASNPLLRRIPVIVLSSSDREVEREESLRLGAHAYLVKPSTFESLSELLLTALSRLPGEKRRPKQAAAKAHQSTREAMPARAAAADAQALSSDLQ
jgi:CheY-like chemotaxis protein